MLFDPFEEYFHTPPATEPAADALRQRLAELDPDGMTPRQALDALYELRDLDR